MVMPSHLLSVFEGVGAYQAGKIDEASLQELEQYGCPTCGSCSGMFTANSMNCLAEGLGLHCLVMVRFLLLLMNVKNLLKSLLTQLMELN